MADLDDELQRIKGTADAATPGPWTSYYWSTDGSGPVTIAIEGTGEQLADVFGNAADATSAPRDAVFIASARSDVDRLIACIEAGLAHRLEELESDGDVWHGHCSCWDEGPDEWWDANDPIEIVDEFEAHRTEQQARALRGEQ